MPRLNGEPIEGPAVQCCLCGDEAAVEDTLIVHRWAVCAECATDIFDRVVELMARTHARRRCDLLDAAAAVMKCRTQTISPA